MKSYRAGIGIMLYKKNKGIFAGKRIEGGLTYSWQMPQGGIDPNESPISAAYRELKEETNITSARFISEIEEWLSYDFPKEMINDLWHGAFVGQRQKWFLMEFIGEESEICIETKEPEFSTWNWENENFLLENVVSFKRDLYRQIFAKFSDLIKEDF